MESLLVLEKILKNIYITFSVPIKKEVTRIGKNAAEISKTIFYRLQFIDCIKFMASSSNLVNNLVEGIHKIKSRYEHIDEKCETCEVNYKDCDCFLKYTNFKDEVNGYVVTKIIEKSLMKT